MQQPLTDTPFGWLRSIPMRIQGEIEVAIYEGVSGFEQGLHGPKPGTAGKKKPILVPTIGPCRVLRPLPR
jgi:hypothetical protein